MSFTRLGGWDTRSGLDFSGQIGMQTNGAKNAPFDGGGALGRGFRLGFLC